MDSTPQKGPRRPLSDLTNDFFETTNSPLVGKRRANDYEGANKRVKILSSKTEARSQRAEDEDDVEMQAPEPACLTVRRRPGMHGILQAIRLGNPVARRDCVSTSLTSISHVCISNSTTVSTLRTLETFVSSNKADVFKCQAVDADSFLTPPYACAYSHGASNLQACFILYLTYIQASKKGQCSTLAVATEQGTVDILNTSKRRDWDPGTKHFGCKEE